MNNASPRNGQNQRAMHGMEQQIESAIDDYLAETDPEEISGRRDALIAEREAIAEQQTEVEQAAREAAAREVETEEGAGDNSQGNSGAGTGDTQENTGQEAPGGQDTPQDNPENDSGAGTGDTEQTEAGQAEDGSEGEPENDSGGEPATEPQGDTPPVIEVPVTTDPDAAGDGTVVVDVNITEGDAQDDAAAAQLAAAEAEAAQINQE